MKFTLFIPTGNPQQQQYQQQYMAQHHAYNYPPQQPAGPVQAQFDAGARFSAQAPPSMQGRQVVMGQKEGGFLKGSGGGGYTFW